MRKISVSLPDADIEFLDSQKNRSAAIHRAIKLLRREQLGDQYSDAFAEFEDSGEQQVWDAAVGDGSSR